MCALSSEVRGVHAEGAHAKHLSSLLVCCSQYRLCLHRCTALMLEPQALWPSHCAPQAGPWSLLSWVWHLMHPIRRAHDARFLADQLGFVAVSLAPKADLTLHFWTISEKQGGSGPSRPAYSFTVKKPDW